MTPQPLAILVVEDYPDAAESLALLLRLVGHEVRVARSCAEAHQVADSFSPDVVLMDLVLVDGDGCALAVGLSTRLDHAAVLIALTGFPNRARDCHEAGLAHLLLKPADPTEMFALLRQSIPCATTADASPPEASAP